MSITQDNARMKKTITRLRKKNHELSIESVEQRKSLIDINRSIEYCKDALDEGVYFLIKQEIKKHKIF